MDLADSILLNKCDLVDEETHKITSLGSNIISLGSKKGFLFRLQKGSDETARIRNKLKRYEKAEPILIRKDFPGFLSRGRSAL